MNPENTSPTSPAREIFLAALDIADAAGRRAYLDQACAGNPTLRTQVDALLASHKEDSFLERPGFVAEATVHRSSANAEPAISIVINKSPAKPLETIRYIGDYELLEEIARGGMGIVYRARQTSLNRTVAVKMILGGQLASEADVKRFRTEAEAAANLKHPNIVAIHETGEHEGKHYFSMDYVEGKNLAQALNGNPLPAHPAALLLKSLAEAVHYAHQRGTLHRDLKPQNVLMDASGQPHITDFGLAKQMAGQSELTQSGTVMGSPSYMPPEQATGKLAEIGPSSDVYSLGAILYQVLTGKVPFVGATPVDTLRQVIENEPVAPSKRNEQVPPDLETVCLKCLEKKPERRYATARALAEELERFLNHEPILAKPASAARKALSWARRNPWALTGAASIVVLALIGLAFGLWERTQFLEWKAQTGLPRKTWPDLFKSPFLMSLIFTPFFLGLFLVWTLKDLRRDSEWKYRLHATLLALVGSLAVISGIYLAWDMIRSLVWQNSFGWKTMLDAMLGGFLVGPVPFTWVGTTLLWRLASNQYAHYQGLTTPAPAPPVQLKLGKLFWLVLVGEIIVVNLLSHWVVAPVPYSPGSGVSAAEWDGQMRVFFVMLSFILALIPLFFILGVRGRGNRRWAFIFVSVILVLSGIHIANSTSQMVADHPQPVVEQWKMVLIWAILTGPIAGGLLLWAGQSGKRSAKAGSDSHPPFKATA